MKKESNTTKVVRRSCPTCEASCGLLVEVDEQNRQILSVHGDPDDHRSKGYVCAKSQAFRYIYEDQQRLRHPVRKTDNGWEQISWQEAFDIVGKKLNEIREQHGKDAIAMYVGNPIGHNYSAQIYLQSLMGLLQTERFFSAGTVDQHPQQIGSFALYGQEWMFPIPDIDNTDLLICMGANPLVSQGSLMSAPDIKSRIEALRARGGKLVVIDPRRTETAEVADQHIFIRPGTDAYMLLSLVNEIFRNEQVSLAHLEGLVDDIDWIRDIAASYPAEETAAITGIGAAVLRQLAADYCATPKAAAYGRIGLCTQQFGTLASWLVDVVGILSGHLDTEGCMMFPRPATSGPGPMPEDVSPHWGRWHSRVSGFPETCGELPASLMAEELEAGGDDQVRALVTICGNPVLSVPNGKRIREAMKSLEFVVALDIYINETTSQADIILPSTVPAEQENYDFVFQGTAVRNFASFSPALLPADDGLLDLWEIECEIAARLGGMAATDLDNFVYEGVVERAIKQSQAIGRALDKETIQAGMASESGPQRVLDVMLRNGPCGDGFDDNAEGLSLEKMRQANVCVDLGPLRPQLPGQLATAGRRIRLKNDILLPDLQRLADHFARAQQSQAAGDANDMLLIGRRHIRDMNSWLHNLTPYIRGKNRCTLMMHSSDAGRIGLLDGQDARVVSRVGEARVPVEITDAIMPGVVSIPHGFGHTYDDSEQEQAGRMPGISCNDLIDDSVLDVASGTSVVNGASVQVFAG